MTGMQRASARRLIRTAALLGLVFCLTGCSYTGLNSFSLPFTKGNGGDAREITVQVSNAANLVPNAEVKYRELTVGSVRKITLDDWTPTLTIGIEGDVQIPADVVAAVAQKSLLGAEYLELKDPSPDEAAPTAAVLEDGDVIGLDRTSRYPETEEVLSAAAMMLNGGGLPQLQTIAREANLALDGNTAEVQSFIRRMATFTGALDRQRGEIVSTLEQLDRLSTGLNKHDDKVKRALDELPQGVAVLAGERPALVRAMRAVDKFGVTFRRVVGLNDDKLAVLLRNFEPLMNALANQGPDVATIPQVLTYPFPTERIGKSITSDYMNLDATIELNAPSLLKAFGPTVGLDGLLPGVVGGTPAGTASDSDNPLTSPLKILDGTPLESTINSLLEGLDLDGLLGSGGGR